VPEKFEKINLSPVILIVPLNISGPISLEPKPLFITDFPSKILSDIVK